MEKLEAKKKVSFTLSDNIISELKKISQDRQLSRSVLVQLALEEYFKKGESNAK